MNPKIYNRHPLHYRLLSHLPVYGHMASSHMIATTWITPMKNSYVLKGSMVSYCFTTHDTGGRMWVLGKFEHGLFSITVTGSRCICTRVKISKSHEINKLKQHMICNELGSLKPICQCWDKKPLSQFNTSTRHETTEIYEGFTAALHLQGLLFSVTCT